MIAKKKILHHFSHIRLIRRPMNKKVWPIDRAECCSLIEVLILVPPILASPCRLRSTLLVFKSLEKHSTRNHFAGMQSFT
jgi:hypothetical protein